MISQVFFSKELIITPNLILVGGFIFLIFTLFVEDVQFDYTIFFKWVETTN